MTSVRSPLAIAIVAGAPMLRAGLAAALADGDGVRAVAQAASWRALHDAGADVDVALLDAASVDDLPLPEDAGDCGLPLLVLLPHGAAAREWLAHGVTVLAADATADMIVAAALAATAGLVSASPATLRAALRLRVAAAASTEPLTPREREVLAQMSQGLPNRAIAQALAISEHTAKFHVAQIIAKLAASSRAHAVAKALRGGLVDL